MRMGKDLISRKALLDRLAHSTTETWGKHIPNSVWPFAVRIKDNIIRVINELPAVDTEPTKQEWISVKDRLPERNEIVLVCAASTARGGKIRFVGAYDGFWFLQTAADTIGLTIQYDVTHWMPLPEPPERMDGE